MNKECETNLKELGVTACEDFTCSIQNKKISRTTVKVLLVEDSNYLGHDTELQGMTFNLQECMRDKMKEILNGNL